MRVALVVEDDFLALARELLQLAQQARCSTHLRSGTAASVSSCTLCDLPSSAQTTPTFVYGLQELAQHTRLLARSKEGHRSFCWLSQHARQLARPKEGHRSFCWLAQHAPLLKRPKEGYCSSCWLARHAQLLNRPKKRRHSFC